MSVCVITVLTRSVGLGIGERITPLKVERIITQNGIGALIIEDDSGSEHHITIGDVQHLRGTT